MNECINHQSAAQTNQAIKELNNDALRVFERGIRSIHEDLVLTATTTTTTRRTREQEELLLQEVNKKWYRYRYCPHSETEDMAILLAAGCA